MQSRRAFLAGAAGAPAFLRAAAERKGRPYAEVERLLAKGDVRGKLTRQDLPTPALVLEWDAFQQNVTKMASFVKQSGRAFRPHAKTHKCPEIALELMKAGAVGACSAKISEAEALAAGGVSGLLVTSAMIGPQRIERAVRLARKRPETIFCVDNAQNAEDMNAAAREARIRFNVAVDLLVGRRTGIATGQPAAALAQRIDSLPALKFAGLQAYAGHASHTQGFENRKRVSEEAMGQAVETRRLVEKSGIACSLVTGGSTGTYNIDSQIEGITELQPGSFIFMDTDYNRIGGKDGAVYQDFRNSLFVIATVISKPADDTVVLDSGYKALATDRPFMPELRNIKGAPFSWGGDEHGRLDISKASAPIHLGDRVEIVAPHCDPTVNLYDHIYVLRGDDVDAVWRIAARGKTQ